MAMEVDTVCRYIMKACRGHENEMVGILDFGTRFVVGDQAPNPPLHFAHEAGWTLSQSGQCALRLSGYPTVANK
jgi:hypothetical protein